jgi:hypothetical protein
MRLISYLTVLALVVACGKVARDTPDGSNGPGDGAAPDAIPDFGEATVEVRLAGTPTADVLVVFHEPDGQVSAEALTDAEGIASATIARGSLITIDAGPGYLLTAGDVQPGDHLVLVTRPPYDGSVATTASVRALSSAPNAAYYKIEVGDDLYVTTQSITTASQIRVERANLDRNGRFHVVVAAYDPNDRPIAYAFQSDVLPVDGTTNVTVPGPWRTDVAIRDTTVSGAPADARTLFVETVSRHAGLTFITSDLGGLPSVPIVGGAASLGTTYLGSFGSIETVANLRFEGPHDITWTVRSSRPPPDIALAGGDLPPRLTGTLDQTDNRRPVAAWTADRDASGGDAVVVSLRYRAPVGTIEWTALVPPDQTGFTFPTLPASLTDQAPAVDTVFTGASLTYVDLDGVEGYAAFRQALPLHLDASYELPLGIPGMVQSSFPLPR